MTPAGVRDLCDFLTACASRAAEPTTLALSHAVAGELEGVLRDDLDAMLSLLRFLLHAGNVEAAENLAFRAARLAPFDGRVQRLLGEALVRRGHPRRGLVALGPARACAIHDARLAHWLARGREALALEERIARGSSRERSPDSSPTMVRAH